ALEGVAEQRAQRGHAGGGLRCPGRGPGAVQAVGRGGRTGRAGSGLVRPGGGGVVGVGPRGACRGVVGPLVHASARSVLASSAIWRSAWRKASCGSAPGAVYLSLNRKNGTPRAPIDAASC